MNYVGKVFFMGPDYENRVMIVYNQDTDSSFGTLWSDGEIYAHREALSGWTHKDVKKYHELRDERSVAAIEGKIEEQKRGDTE